MRSPDIFLSLEGRLDRERWLGAVAMFVGIVVATFFVTWLLARSGVIGPAARDGARAFVQVALLVPWLTLDWKRFQDLGRPGRWALICPGLIALSRLLSLPAISSRVPAPQALAEGVAWVQIPVAMWLAYALGTLRGSEGPNRYGPDPRGPGPVALDDDPASPDALTP